MTMRRQHNSCDQCRISKRACDAAVTEHLEGDASFLPVGFQAPVPNIRPCSYCAKTNKTCTIKWAWKQLCIRRSLRESEESRMGGKAPQSQRLGLHSGAAPVATGAPEKQLFPFEMNHVDPIHSFSDESWSFGSYSAPLDEPSEVLVWPSEAGSLTGNQTIGSASTFGCLDDNIVLTEESAESGLLRQGIDSNSASNGLASDASESFPGLQPCFGFVDNLGLQQVGDEDRASGRFGRDVSTDWLLPDSSGANTNVWRDTRDQFQEFEISDVTFPSSRKGGQGRHPLNRRKTPRRGYGSHDRHKKRLRSYSSLLVASDTFAAETNKSLISGSLFQIYHDVMEHSLSCWLTEVSYPYRPSQISPQQRVVRADWGPLWSNRIYQRTLHLENAVKEAGLVQLTPAEDQACSRALHLAIMAFATQWSQGSCNRQRPYGSPSLDSELLMSHSEGPVDFDNGFDREIQWYSYTRAVQALQAVAQLDCFRVVWAEVILGLTQAPTKKRFDPSPNIRPVTEVEKGRVAREISEVIQKDGPPVFIEQASRRMHRLKFGLDLAIRTGSGKIGGSSSETVQLQASISEYDQDSVGLLYWLTVMFDTISGSMNQRPLVVLDQDCHHQDSLTKSPDIIRWDVELFVQDDLDAPSELVRWPCTYGKAAEAITKSGPVKILLYRHVSWLQNLVRQGHRGAKVEEIIHSAMTLYRYWNLTYGNFFAGLVDNFEEVPERIQSWFVCISAHWHLASMMLADMLHTVDVHGLGRQADAEIRRKGDIVNRMQEETVKELSDLARVATPEKHGQNGPQLQGFHPSVGEGTILTEPWSALLIRAFSKAAVLLLDKAEEYRRDALTLLGNNALAENLRRAEDCVEGLWLLGKKSDSACEVAGILARELSRIKELANLGSLGGIYTYHENFGMAGPAQ